MNADGSDSARQITKNSKTLITSFAVSPNGKWIAYNDKNEVLTNSRCGTGAVKFMYDSSFGGVNEIGWSPDSRFLNFTRSIENLHAQICMVDMRNMKIDSGYYAQGSTATALPGRQTAVGFILSPNETWLPLCTVRGVRASQSLIIPKPPTSMHCRWIALPRFLFYKPTPG